MMPWPQSRASVSVFLRSRLSRLRLLTGLLKRTGAVVAVSRDLGDHVQGRIPPAGFANGRSPMRPRFGLLHDLES